MIWKTYLMVSTVGTQYIYRVTLFRYVISIRFPWLKRRAMLKYDKLRFQEILPEFVISRNEKSPQVARQWRFTTILSSWRRKDHTRNSTMKINNLCRVCVWFLSSVEMTKMCRSTLNTCNFFCEMTTRRKYSYENECPSPDRSGNPFSGFFSQEKIGTDSGISSWKKNINQMCFSRYTTLTKLEPHVIKNLLFIKNHFNPLISG